MIDIGSPYALFMAECEGLHNIVNTSAARVNAVINEIERYYYDVSIDIDDIINIAKDLGIYDLTEEELTKILQY